MNNSNEITEKAIIAVELALLIAMKNGNIQKLDELIHEDLLFIIPNGQIITKAIDLESYRSGNMNISEISSSNITINLIDDNAIVSVIINMSGKFMDQTFEGKFRFLRVWKFVNNQWKIIGGSSTQL